MTRKLSTAERLAEFQEFQVAYGHEVANALHNQAQHMRQAAKEAQDGYEQVKAAGPEAEAAQDKTLVTTNGLATMARMFTEAAASAEQALDAWEALEDEEDSP